MSAAKMFGPYKQIEDAIEAGFGHILRMGDSNKKEYAFVVALKREDRSYCYTEPQTSSSLSYVNLNIDCRLDLLARLLHNHPATLQTLVLVVAMVFVC